MFVKICGITNLADAQHAVAAGADSVGFVLTDSPRQVDPDAAAVIARELPDDALTVGVFRDADPAFILEALTTIGLRSAQVHAASPDHVGFLRERVPFLIEAVSAGSDPLGRIGESPADLVLVDSANPGSGRTFDRSSLDAAPTARLVLAGGLTPDNVARAIDRVRPFGVDVASGVEAEPGHKDHGKVRLFVERAGQAAVQQEA